MQFYTYIVPVQRFRPSDLWRTSQIVSVARVAPEWSPLEKVAVKRISDNYMKDTRNWPDPTEPRASKPPAPDGCTCALGMKLHCPVHGMDAIHDGFEDSWANVQQANPVGYPQDAPRNFNFNLMHSSIVPVVRIKNDEGLEDRMNTIDGDEDAVIANETRDPHLRYPQPNPQVQDQTWQQTYAYIVPVRRIIRS